MIVLADQDVPTRSASGFVLRHVSPRAGLMQLYGSAARNHAFDAMLRFTDYLIAVGHGTPDMIAGQKESVILKVNDYPEWEAKGRFFKLIACQTAKELGPDLIAKGAAAFQGYTEDFLWIADEEQWDDPWTDQLAMKFLTPVIDACNLMLDGETAEGVYNREVAGYDAAMRNETDEFNLSLMSWNRRHFVSLGNPQARIKRRPNIHLPFPPPKFLPFFMP